MIELGNFPNTYPTEQDFIQASAVISYEETIEQCLLDGIEIASGEVEYIMGLMTPKLIRDSTSHGGQLISPNLYPTFADLLSSRNRIRDLQLVPIRSANVQAEYEKMERTTFLSIVQMRYLHRGTMALVREMYPSATPSEVSQYVVWVRDDTVPDYQMADFIARIIAMKKLTQEDVILFERSRVTETHFVKAAVPEYRHIHLWMRDNSNF